MVFAAILCLFVVASPATADCPEEAPLQNYTGASFVTCPCFVTGEQAGAVLEAPPEHYPIEILRVGIGWASTYGGTPQSLEQAIHIYDAGLPNPGTPIFTIAGPQLTDGFINEFDFEPLPGEIIIDSGPFSVALEFANSNAGDIYAPSMIHDGNGCQAGKNVVFAIPGGWYDACVLGVSGDWVVYAVYRQVDCGAGVGEDLVASGDLAILSSPQPNPFSGETRLEFVLSREQAVDLSVYDIHGRAVSTLARGMFSAGSHGASWSGTASDGTSLSPGVYFITLKAGSVRSSRRVILGR